jgi:inorganic pyrophosphatase
MHDLGDIGQHWLLEIENFFRTYKVLEPKWSEVVGWEDAAVAHRVIHDARSLYTRGLEGRLLP